MISEICCNALLMFTTCVLMQSALLDVSPSINMTKRWQHHQQHMPKALKLWRMMNMMVYMVSCRARYICAPTVNELSVT